MWIWRVPGQLLCICPGTSIALDVCLVLFLEMLKASWKLKFECYEKVKRSNSTCCKRKINKLEIAIFASAFAFPLLFDWIPFTTNSYGPSIEGVCWFRDQNCSQNTLCTAELWEQIWLLTVPVGFVGILIMVLFTILLCLLIYNIKAEWTGGHWLTWQLSTASSLLPSSSSPYLHLLRCLCIIT